VYRPNALLFRDFLFVDRANQVLTVVHKCYLMTLVRSPLYGQVVHPAMAGYCVAEGCAKGIPLGQLAGFGKVQAPRCLAGARHRGAWLFEELPWLASRWAMGELFGSGSLLEWAGKMKRYVLVITPP
jgi:hypothetical protein